MSRYVTPCRALVADDDAVVRELVRAILVNMGQDVVLAQDGLEALAAVGEQRFDLVITDVEMPGCSGLDVVQAIRDLPPGTLVVVMSGEPGQETAALEAGARAFVAEPFTSAELTEAVRYALEPGDDASPSA